MTSTLHDRVGTAIAAFGRPVVGEDGDITDGSVGHPLRLDASSVGSVIVRAGMDDAAELELLDEVAVELGMSSLLVVERGWDSRGLFLKVWE